MNKAVLGVFSLVAVLLSAVCAAFALPEGSASRVLISRVGSTSMRAVAHGTKSIRDLEAVLQRSGELPARLSKVSLSTQPYDKALQGERSRRLSKRSNPCNKPRIKRLLKRFPGYVCEPDWVVRSADLPNDTNFSQLWGLRQNSDFDIDADEAWDYTHGSSGVIVGVIDTGIQYTHPDLNDNIWTNPGEIPANGVDDDGNGYIDDIHGFDFANNDADPMDDHSHGTHCAGTIGAEGNNSQGVTGVNWQIKMVALKFMSSSGSGYTSDAVRAVNYLTWLKVNAGEPVIASSNSWGGAGYSFALESAISAAAAQGILFIAAAGNDGTDNSAVAHYPSNYNVSNVVSVAALASNGTLAGYSNYGSNVDIAAPGSGIYSTIPGSTYGSKSGTSMATPHVAGVVALLKAAYPSISMSEILDAIYNGSTQEGFLSGKVVGEKMLNAHGALQAAALLGVPTATPTIAPTATPIPTATPQPTATPEATATPEPQEPQITPAPTATMTPTPPAGRPSLRLNPSKVRPGKRLTLLVQNGGENASVRMVFGSASCAPFAVSDGAIDVQVPVQLSRSTKKIRASLMSGAGAVVAKDSASVDTAGLSGRAVAKKSICLTFQRSLSTKSPRRR